jgi:seryl-tRNA synthetase
MNNAPSSFKAIEENVHSFRKEVEKDFDDVRKAIEDVGDKFEKANEDNDKKFLAMANSIKEMGEAQSKKMDNILDSMKSTKDDLTAATKKSSTGQDFISVFTTYLLPWAFQCLVGIFVLGKIVSFFKLFS